jgi:hypothetical protein
MVSSVSGMSTFYHFSFVEPLKYYITMVFGLNSMSSKNVWSYLENAERCRPF